MSFKLAMRRLCWMAALLLYACSAPLTVAPVQLYSEQRALRIAAEDALVNTVDAPVLRLREHVSDAIESTGSSGAASAYKVRYRLNYQLANKPAGDIMLEEVVPHNESKYLAGRRARDDAVIRLRRRALEQIRYILVNQNR